MAGVKSLFVTIKATLNCNLGCLYCYGRDNASIMKEMSDEEVKSALKFVCEYAAFRSRTCFNLLAWR